jgi:hypothetical protein
VIHILTDRLTIDDKQRVQALFALLGINGYVFCTVETLDLAVTNLIVIGARNKAYLDKNKPNTPYVYFEDFKVIFEPGHHLELKALSDSLNLTTQGVALKPKVFDVELDSLEDPIIVYTSAGNWVIWPDSKFPANPSPTDLKLSHYKVIQELKKVFSDSPIGILSS